MKGAERTMGELRAFWKERYVAFVSAISSSRLLTLTFNVRPCLCINRAAIEDDYAKRLNKLAKHTLGRYEIGYERIILKASGAF